MRVFVAFPLLFVLLSGCNGEDPPPQDDRDGDFLLDADELAGWDVELRLRAPRCLEEDVVETETRHVTSSETSADTDQDGVDDLLEFTFRSNPQDADTDDDGLSDAEERDIKEGGAVQSGGSLKLTWFDSDNDCLGDAAETRGVDVAGFGKRVTDPTVADTDHDGLTDGEEAVGTATDPLNPDTDGDSLNDRIDADPLHDIGVRLTFQRFALKTGSGPVQFYYNLDGPNGSHMPSAPPSLAIDSGENQSVPSGFSPQILDVVDVERPQFQFWVVRDDGSNVDITPGEGGAIVSGTIDHDSFTWEAAGRSGSARGETHWFSGPGGDLAFSLEVVYL